MRNLSLVLLFSILTLTMCDGMESQACTPTEGYACCFAPGEVNTIFCFKHLKQCNGGNTIPDSRSNPMWSRWVWTTATATLASFASSTVLMTWVTQIPNMMEPQRHVVAWIKYYDCYCCLDLIKCCCSKSGRNWSICITHLYRIESSQIVVRYHHHELCAPKDETWSTEGAKTGWHHAATSGVSPVCELCPANRCDHKLAL